MRCARCGNENPGTNRFCGMCGATMLPPPASAQNATVPPAPVVPAAPVATPLRPTATRPAAPIAEDTPPISGPSFLGLNQPATPTEPRRRGSLSIDPNSAPSSRNLDYLLEDEHEHKGGALKYVLILLALALAVGFGYLRFKDQGLAWLKGTSSKPAATQGGETPEPGSTAPVEGAGNAGAPAGSAQPAATPTTTAPDSSAGNPPSSSAATPPATNPAGSAPANPTPSAVPSSATPANGDAGGDSAAATKPTTPPAAAKKPKPAASDDTDSDADSDSDSAPTAADSPKTAAKATKPSASVSGRSDAAVIEARNYIYGRGVRQDCERGMRLLKPAAAQANPQAMIEMGALYSAGLCTPRDLPTAYRWFAMALRKQPDNESVQTDLQKLWGEMTQPERQLAIKLSQ